MSPFNVVSNWPLVVFSLLLIIISFTICLFLVICFFVLNCKQSNCNSQLYTAVPNEKIFKISKVCVSSNLVLSYVVWIFFIYKFFLYKGTHSVITSDSPTISGITIILDHYLAYDKKLTDVIRDFLSLKLLPRPFEYYFSPSKTMSLNFLMDFFFNMRKLFLSHTYDTYFKSIVENLGQLYSGRIDSDINPAEMHPVSSLRYILDTSWIPHQNILLTPFTIQCLHAMMFNPAFAFTFLIFLSSLFCCMSHVLFSLYVQVIKTRFTKQYIVLTHFSLTLIFIVFTLLLLLIAAFDDLFLIFIGMQSTKKSLEYYKNNLIQYIAAFKYEPSIRGPFNTTHLMSPIVAPNIPKTTKFIKDIITLTEVTSFCDEEIGPNFISSDSTWYTLSNSIKASDIFQLASKAFHRHLKYLSDSSMKLFMSSGVIGYKFYLQLRDMIEMDPASTFLQYYKNKAVSAINFLYNNFVEYAH